MYTHTHTHTHTSSSQIRPSLVPLRHFAQLPLLGQHKPDQGEESGTEPSSCVSLVLLLSRLTVSQRLERMGIGATFNRVLILA